MAIISRTEQRLTDSEGFINYGTNRYQMPSGCRGRLCSCTTTAYLYDFTRLNVSSASIDGFMEKAESPR